MQITEAEVLEALRAASPKAGARGEEGFTSSEAAEALGIGQRGAALRLAQLRRQGVLRAVKVLRMDPWGHWHTRPGYQIVKAR